MTKTEPLLETRNLTHRFSNGTIGIEKISFTVSKGDFLIISGPNGSGKSVLMKHLNGLLNPTEGEIFLFGESIHKDIKKTRQMIGLVFQDADSQIIGQTVERDVAFGPENLKLPREEIDRRVENSLENVNLITKRKVRPHVLSGGEKRRLAVAGVLAMDSEILIFDEPFSNLDYPGVQKVLQQIVSLHKAGHTIIVITHDLGKILAHSTSLIIMNRGKIAAQGKPETLVEQLEQWGIRRPEGKSLKEMTWLK